MRFFCLAASALLALVPLVVAQAHDTPELGIVTTFPNNPYSSKSALFWLAQSSLGRILTRSHPASFVAATP